MIKAQMIWRNEKKAIEYATTARAHGATIRIADIRESFATKGFYETQLWFNDSSRLKSYMDTHEISEWEVISNTIDKKEIEQSTLQSSNSNFYTVWHKGKHAGAVWIIDRTYGLKSYAHEIAKAISVGGKYTTVLPQGQMPSEEMSEGGYIVGHWYPNLYKESLAGGGWFGEAERHARAAEKGMLRRRGY